MGGTSLALDRRRRNAPLFSRVFVGDALDVGGAPDPLRPDPAWPRLRDVLVLDLPDDGHDLSRFPDHRFDVVYSSHTLEHMAEPYRALGEWWRVLKPGGHIVLVVPDETLYEHDVWPSVMNSGHLHHFTTRRGGMAISVLSLCYAFSPHDDFRLVSLQWLADGYDPQRAAEGADLTASGECECGIELILHKP